MATKMKIVCPKCKAKLKLAPEKIRSEVTKFKCPGCRTTLKIRKSALKQEAASQPTSSSQEKIWINMEDPGSESFDLARKLEEEMGFTEEGQEEEPVEKQEEERPKGIESRDFKRVKFKEKVLVDNQIMVEALDISEEGLFLHTGRSFDDGAMVEVGIPTMPGTFDLKVQAKVRHNHRGIGMGLQFVDLDNKQKTKLDKLINTLDEAARHELEGRKKILLIGGTDTARNINKSKLVLDGFYVLQATTADEVFRILDEEPPDAMVLEWQETQFFCKGLLSQIKANPDNDAIIRVVLSALTDASVQQEIIDAGAHRCMAKMDTNPARLSLTLKQLIEERDP